MMKVVESSKAWSDYYSPVDLVNSFYIIDLESKEKENNLFYIDSAVINHNNPLIQGIYILKCIELIFCN